MKKYAIAGASSRAYWMYAKALTGLHEKDGKLVGVFDPNPTRAAYIVERCGSSAFGDFEEMLVRTQPDVVIVATVDAYHHKYIIKALHAGCDVISEKPLSTDAGRISAILAAERDTGHKIAVTFNYRYVPLATKIKEMLLQGVVGQVFSVDFEWMLDRNMSYGAHGTSYGSVAKNS